jgi:hypothetical protein
MYVTPDLADGLIERLWDGALDSSECHTCASWREPVGLEAGDSQNGRESRSYPLISGLSSMLTQVVSLCSRLARGSSTSDSHSGCKPTVAFEGQVGTFRIDAREGLGSSSRRGLLLRLAWALRGKLQDGDSGFSEDSMESTCKSTADKFSDTTLRRCR